MRISDVGRSGRTWIHCVYDLKPRVRLAPATSLGDVFDFGRFQGHIDASARLLPRVAFTRVLAAGRLVPPGVLACPLGDTTMLMLVTPRGDPLLVLEVELVGEPNETDVASFLAATCYWRDEITIDGRPIMSWLDGELALPQPLAFDRNVHQCVFPGGQLREDLLAATVKGLLSPAVISIVYRSTLNAEGEVRLGVSTPPALNCPGETIVAHTRGVSLIVGWSEQVENLLSVAALTIVSAMGVLYRTRDLAFDALDLNQSTRLASLGDARELLSQLSARLNDVQLDLSFGVEAYVDSVLIPEEIVDSFQESIREATDLDSGVENTSRMVGRLADVIRARAAVLEAATQEEQERRGRVFNLMLALGSLVALPPSLLLAFFGVASRDIDPGRSILDLSRYWIAYGLAWLPFVGLFLIGFMLRRRIRQRSRLVDGDDHGEAPVGRVTFPAPPAGPPRSRQPEPVLRARRHGRVAT